MALKMCAQCYIVYICIGICQYFISVLLYQYVYFFIVLYIEKTLNYY